MKQLPEKLNPVRCRAFRHDVAKAMAEMIRPAIIFQVPPSARLDAPHLDFLIHCARVAADHDAEVAIAAPNGEHQVLLEVTRLSSVVPTFPSVEKAAAYLDKYRTPKLDPQAANSGTTPGSAGSERERNPKI